MQLLSFNEFMAKNEDWLHNDEKIGEFAYKNYCDTTTRYKEEIVTLQDLIQELEKATLNLGSTVTDGEKPAGTFDKKEGK